MMGRMSIPVQRKRAEARTHGPSTNHIVAVIVCSKRSVTRIVDHHIIEHNVLHRRGGICANNACVSSSNKNRHMKNLMATAKLRGASKQNTLPEPGLCFGLLIVMLRNVTFTKKALSGELHSAVGISGQQMLHGCAAQRSRESDCCAGLMSRSQKQA